ncbi:MAG: sugar ABC transporter permease [Clostridia bacterium]|nr:sugar ABC transporter permease [Clostridia bacterium]
MKNNKGGLQKRRSKYITQLPILALCVPVILYMLIFNYIPMGGVIIAFKNYTPIEGIFGSRWVGFANFDYFFKTDASSVLLKTIGYNMFFIFLNMFLSIVIALLLFEVNSKNCIKLFQTSMSLPHTISYVIVAYIVYALFAYDTGIINHFLTSIGKEPILWYNEPKYWPLILTVTQAWKGIGMGSVIYYGTLMGIDNSLFEAAALDGAGRFKQTLHVSIPALIPIICILLITNVGGVLGGDQALFYQVPRDSAALYSTTDVLSTYLQRGVTSGNLSVTSAVGLFQNVVGLVMLLITNGIISKISPENSLL